MMAHVRGLLDEGSALYHQYGKSVFHLYGPGRKHKEYLRYIILARSRTGSNYLRGMLNSHPQTICYGEIFARYDRARGGLPARYFNRGNRLLAELRARPVEYLEKHVFAHYSLRVRAVGFKIFYYHATTQATWESVWPYLVDNTDIRVLHLKRRNILKTHRARKRAVQSGRWFSYKRDTRRHEPAAVLDADECLSDFEQTRRYERDYDELFSRHRVCELYYEDLARDPSNTMARVQSFLDVRPREVRALTSKQSSRKLAQAIANFDELRESFANTPWEQFFRE